MMPLRGMRRCAAWTIVVLLLLPLMTAAEDPYVAWSAGRPAEALPALHEQAQRTDRWQDWLDLGLCAAAADRRGPAMVWLLEAHRRAPARDEPRAALTALGAPLPTGISQRLGPLALPGSTWFAIPLAVIAGILLGYGLLGRRGRVPALIIGSLALVLLAPGSLAAWLDGRRRWLANAEATHLLDSTGTPREALPAGTLLERLPGDPWNGRLAVRLPDGRSGWVAEVDTQVKP